MVTWSPLRSGLLSGKYNQRRPKDARLTLERYADLHGIVSEANLETARRIAEVAEDMGVPMAQLAIAWLLRLPQVSSVITGATKVEQLLENLGALDVVDRLNEEVLERIEGVLGNKPGPED